MALLDLPSVSGIGAFAPSRDIGWPRKTATAAPREVTEFLLEAIIEEATVIFGRSSRRCRPAGQQELVRNSPRHCCDFVA